jgi:hypothetical protein
LAHEVSSLFHPMCPCLLVSQSNRTTWSCNGISRTMSQKKIFLFVS